MREMVGFCYNTRVRGHGSRGLLSFVLSLLRPATLALLFILGMSLETLPGIISWLFSRRDDRGLFETRMESQSIRTPAKEFNYEKRIYTL